MSSPDATVGSPNPEFTSIPLDSWNFWNNPHGVHLKRIAQQDNLNIKALELNTNQYNAVSDRGERYSINPKQRMLVLDSNPGYTINNSVLNDLLNFSLEYRLNACYNVSGAAVKNGVAESAIHGNRISGSESIHTDGAHFLPIVKLKDGTFLFFDTSAGGSIARSLDQRQIMGTDRKRIGDEEFNLLIVHAQTKEELIKIATDLYGIAFKEQEQST